MQAFVFFECRTSSKSVVLEYGESCTGTMVISKPIITIYIAYMYKNRLAISALT